MADDRQHLELRRPAAENVRHRAHETLAQTVVGNDQDADHLGLVVMAAGVDESGAVNVSTRFQRRPSRISASANMPPTSNPDCSAISTKHVGLVTLTSVR